MFILVVALLAELLGIEKPTLSSSGNCKEWNVVSRQLHQSEI